MYMVDPENILALSLITDHYSAAVDLRMQTDGVDRLHGEIPDHIEDIMETTKGGAPCSMAFNRRGTLLAVGTNDGFIALFDFDTKCQVATMQGHEEGSSVKALAWSRDGRTLVSAADDGQVVLWDVPSGKMTLSRKLPSPDVNSLTLSQRHPFTGLVSYSKPMSKLQHRSPSIVHFDTGSISDLISLTESDVTLIDSVLSKDGRFVFLSQGTRLSKLDVSNLQTIETVVINSPATKISLGQNSLIVSCEDGRIFIYPTEGALTTPQGPFFHSIDASMVTRWSDFCLTQDGCYLAAAADLLPLRRPNVEHLVYIWSLASCELVRVLEGLDNRSKYNVVAIVAHPMFPCLVTALDPASPDAALYIWAKIRVCNWSAYAPDFEELQENKQYVEKEDEFDWNTDGNMSTKIQVVERRRAEDAQDPLVVDVYSIDKLPYLPSDEEEDERGFFYMPVVIGADTTPVDEPEEEGKPIELEEDQLQAKTIEDIEEAEMEELEDSDPQRRKTRSRGNSRVNSRAGSPAAVEDDHDAKRRKN